MHSVIVFDIRRISLIFFENIWKQDFHTGSLNFILTAHYFRFIYLFVSQESFNFLNNILHQVGLLFLTIGSSLSSLNLGYFNFNVVQVNLPKLHFQQIHGFSFEIGLESSKQCSKCTTQAATKNLLILFMRFFAIWLFKKFCLNF